MSSSKRPTGPAVPRLPLILTLVILAAVLPAGNPATAPGFVNEATLLKEAGFTLTLYGFPPEPIDVSGQMTITYTDPYLDPDSHIMIDCEILDLELAGTGIIIRENAEAISLGSMRSIDVGIDFPAESFFDVMYEIELPGVFPGETLLTYEPMHLTSVIGAWPPYGFPYEMSNPVITVYNEGGLAVGEITLWTETNLPLIEPKALVIVDAEYGSDVAEEFDDDLVEVRASIDVPDDEVVSAQFLFRESGAGPFIPFWTDLEGIGGNYGTISVMESGDGWAGYLDISGLSTAGGYYDVMVDF
ncbi:MAG TPA: hypothetical protein VLA34_09785, partial [Candidatus Krumholzibacterium sp.]|nr:hypothetical protein [Candidatus Krumholzibacterium sp.]